jgi:hypothetical protein
VADQKALDIIKDFQRASTNRGNFESLWTKIGERIWPSHATLFSSKGFTRNGGEQHTQNFVDATGALALDRFGAIVDSLLTPRNQTWNRLMASNPHVNKDRQTTLWFEEANRLLYQYRYAPKSNFASQNQQNFLALGAWGTGCVFIDRLRGIPSMREMGIRYKAVHLAEVYFEESHQGIIDKATRHFPFTARQAIQEFGVDKLPPKIVNAAEKEPDRLFYFLHCVKPRADLDPRRIDYKGMPYASYYVSVDEQVTIREGGYTTFPYAVSRYTQAPNEVYGRSPAMLALPALMTLNEQKKTVLKQGHRAVDPVLLASDDGIVNGFSMRPGAINAGGVSSDGRPLVHALPVGNLAVAKEMMDDERQLINDAFLVTLFQILTETPTMTATEVMERTREKGILLAPTVGRQQSEYLGPMIERELDILVEQGLLPPMPPALIEAKGEYKIEYDSPLSRAQRAEEASGIMRTVEHALQVVNVTQDPAPLDHFNWDVIIPELASIQGVPAKWMRSDKEVMEIRSSRQDSAETQTAIQAAPAAAAMVKAQAVAGKGKPPAA